MGNVDKNNSLSDSEAPLRYHEWLDYFQETIDQVYTKKDVAFFRTVRSNPPTEKDIVPTKFLSRETDEIQTLEIEFDADIVSELTDEEKRIEVGHHAISGYQTAEKCKSEAIRAYKGVKKKHGPENAEAFKNRHGQYIAKFLINPELGMITDFDRHKKHANILIKENVKIKDLIDPSFPLEYFEYE